MKLPLAYLLLAPTVAHAAPVTLFFAGLGLSATAAAIATQVVITVGLQLISSVLFRPKQTSAAKIPNILINTRLENAVRWQAAGTVSRGGSVGTFAEKDASGNLWYIVAHADAEITGTPSYVLDGIPVTLSTGSGGFTAGDVLTNDFCLNTDGGQYDGTGTQVAVFRLYTVTPSAGNVYGALPAAFTAAFAALPANFRLAGVCFTIVRCAAQSANPYKVAYRWRGSLGLGEPSVAITGNFNRMYDPRNGAHNINNSTTWTASNGNSAIIWAWWRTTSYGRNRPMTEINWTEVAAAANLCDVTVLDLSSVPTPLYRCGIAFPDDMARQECEKAILETCDGYVAYDDAGAAYPVVGYYTAPSMSFTAGRDIISAQTLIIDDGEAAIDGVIVYYTEPALGYTRQPAAPWQNTQWYVSTAIPNYAQIDIPGCQNHNQAVRLAKANGRRIGAARKASLATTVKGLLARSERIISLTYDATFTGDYQIISPVEEDATGMAFGFTVVPVASDNWTLNAGEEGLPPQPAPVLGVTVPDVINPVPAVLDAASASGAVGSYTASYTTANDDNQFAIALWRGATNVFSAATQRALVYAGPNVSAYVSETVAAGTWYVWLQPRNAAGKSGTKSGPFTVTVT